ncbi:MAG TPA: asparagine synthase-related protein, partial [Rhodothermales bacterium]|nr:asparagine synthase-related protein [Rhodothermales bacterium]
MSGIAGLYYFDGRQVGPGLMEHMVDSMAGHRGPDAQAVWSDGQIGLAHCMLYTTPESLSEHLPAANCAGNIVITADARIDNREELLAALGRSVLGQDCADSQLLLAGYERWGEAVVSHLVGDFAFVVWDARARRLFCAVDQLGAGQLYYTHRPNRFFACGSEIKALAATDEVVLEIDEVRLGESLAWMRRPPDSTVFKGVSKLPPAHAMSIEPAGIKLWRYWTIEPSEEATQLNREACTERFLELFTEAVRCRIRSAYPVGIELSGGLDSSFVTGVARSIVEREGGPDLKTYSNVYDDVAGSDERYYIRQMLALGGLEPHFIRSDQYGPLSTARDMYDYLDDGRMGVGGTYRRWQLFKTAKQTGARVLLTGIDGDTTVSHGREYFAELAAEERWDDFAREAEQYVGRLGQERASYDTQEASIDSPSLILQKAGYP